MNETTITCKRGTARLRISKRGYVQILCNQRRKWDSLHWSFYSDASEVALQGLWRGRYADAVATTENFTNALREIGAGSIADHVLKAGQTPLGTC